MIPSQRGHTHAMQWGYRRVVLVSTTAEVLCHILSKGAGVCVSLIKCRCAEHGARRASVCLCVNFNGSQ